MDITELQKTHAEHAKRVADWRKWRAVYGGTDAIIAGKYFRVLRQLHTSPGGPKGAEDYSPRREPGVGDEGKRTPDGVTEGGGSVKRQFPLTMP
jgi:hypothetical protein